MDFYGMATGYPFQEKASFGASNSSLGRIWDMGWRTARLCAGETYFDCPHYEQMQYVGDTRIQAGDEEWARRQLENAIRYERESGLAMMVVADRLEALTRLAQSERVLDILITPQMIDSYQDSIRAQGFSAEELEACRALNLTPEEIEEMKNEILSDRELEGPASLYESARELAAALRDFARLLTALPVF